jgi:thymidine phosphorylase
VKGAQIDPAVGFMLRRKIGEAVRPDDSLIDIHAASPAAAAQVAERVAAAFTISPDPVPVPPLILGTY